MNIGRTMVGLLALEQAGMLRTIDAEYPCYDKPLFVDVPIKRREIPSLCAACKPAGKVEILFDSRQQRRAREREKPIAVAKARGRRRK